MDLHRISRRLLTSRRLRGMSGRGRLRVVVFFPLLCFAAALLFAGEALLYQLRSERVTGTVIESYEWHGETIFDRGTINYEPVFAYEVNGDSTRGSVGSGHSSFNLDLGDTAPIRVIPGERGNVRMDTWVGMWFVPLVLAGFGVAALAVALLVWALLNWIFWRKEPS
ncbi:hypothetical protein OG2516_06142 [Oceanicola granulosus HTCC2516]|uniref:DUF3592 domain-containing protein n=1 Tax=Oceanicola granulosus (strain ATCC BAA-861 / DSM 15982 / KCTC 12143 / HTCC2516) TaxID=314256 RepID=Q2CDD6_OCEGH|nr:DUF3592 domain-containing protein [Oceanicola granulosus]EAR50654.1 hypothetical protein OG2516_06142 [Oceanicola granulosus HTCC2516]